MKRHLLASPPKKAQTLVLFILVFGAIVLLLGLAIDSGLLYLAKARLSRAVDGAALAAVGNFNLGNDQVAKTMRNFAAANFSDLNSTATTATGVQSSYTLANGQTALIYTYSFNDTTLAQPQDSNGQYKRYVQVILKTGSGGQITSATCNARCPVRTYFMGYAGAFFKDLKVSSSAVATRNPRLIMVVVDRSGSMLGTNPNLGTYGGAYGLPASIVTFLNFFDTTSDYIGLVSFSSNARLEMPLTTNFLYDGTNVLFDTYQIDTNGVGIPGVDPEDTSATHATFSTNGVRRMKFGGSTAADEGMRLALEQMMASAGFNNPDVNKYIVLFTDGAWNNARSLLAAPGYTNVTILPPSGEAAAMPTGAYITNGSATNTIPAFSPYVDYTNAIADVNVTYVNDGTFHYEHHTNDIWQSVDNPIGGVYYESDPLTPSGPNQGPTAPRALGAQGLPVWPSAGASVANITTEGQPVTVTNYPYIGTTGGVYTYTTNLNVWLTPGSVDYVYTHTNDVTPSAVYVSNFNNPTLTNNIPLPPGGKNVLVVPGYLVDGTFTDSLDLPYPGDANVYRSDNYMMPYMWPDDKNTPSTSTYVDGGYFDFPYTVDSDMRNLMHRNYINLLTGYYIYRADDPLQAQITGGYEPLAPTDAYPAGYPRPLHGLGPYYPSAGFYWPFDLVGLDYSPNNELVNPLVDPSNADDPHARNISWSINMLSSNAAPNWAGELFYKGSQGSTVYSSSTAVSTQMASSDWENVTTTTPGSWLENFIQKGKLAGILIDDPSHYGTGSTNIINGIVLRPVTFNGSNNAVAFSSIDPSDAANVTGGYVSDGAGNYYRNAMAYSGRPTHYYNFATGSWTRIQDNHVGTTSQVLGEWRAREYAWHARAAGVTIYTVGYGGSVNNDECVLLAEVANATNVMLKTGPSTNFLSSSYNTQQPIGQEFYATTTNDISNDFYQVGTAINAALTQ